MLMQEIICIYLPMRVQVKNVSNREEDDLWWYLNCQNWLGRWTVLIYISAVFHHALGDYL